MKKIFLFLLAVLLSGAAFADGSMAKPKYLFAACQKGAEVMVVNCKTNETKKFDGFLKNLGVDKNGNFYLLVCDWMSGWGNYTVYKNSSIYMSLKSDKNIIYSSMAMCVSEDDVVVAGTQVKKFNDKGYESRLIGYKNNVLAYQTDWERKSLKRDQFHGYSRIVGCGSNTKLEAIKGQNDSECPEGYQLSVGYHVDAVDYEDGDIYATGWGEREYSETPIGFTKQYLVRRCPRVWKNGHNYVEQHENQTGAAWNINVFKYHDKEFIFTSGHHRNKPCAWEHSTIQLEESENSYPGIVSEATFFVGIADGKVVLGRIFLIKQGNGYRERGVILSGNKVIQEWGAKESSHTLESSDEVVACKSSFYRIKDVKTDKVVWGRGNFQKEDGKYVAKNSGAVATLPSDFVVRGSKIAVYE